MMSLLISKSSLLLVTVLISGASYYTGENTNLYFVIYTAAFWASLILLLNSRLLRIISICCFLIILLGDRDYKIQPYFRGEEMRQLPANDKYMLSFQLHDYQAHTERCGRLRNLFVLHGQNLSQLDYDFLGARVVSKYLHTNKKRDWQLIFLEPTLDGTKTPQVTVEIKYVTPRTKVNILHSSEYFKRQVYPKAHYILSYNDNCKFGYHTSAQRTLPYESPNEHITKPKLTKKHEKLLRAMSIRDYKAMKKVLRDKNIDLSIPISGKPLLYTAIENNDVKSVALFLEHSPPVHGALIQATAYGNLRAMKRLLRNGSSPNENFLAERPLSMAANLGSHELADLLLQNGAIPVLQDAQAAKRYGHLGLSKKLSKIRLKLAAK